MKNTYVKNSYLIKILFCFLCVYVIWGSTYLAIKYALESFPPFLMAGSRFIIAALILGLFARWRGEAWPPRTMRRAAMVSGILLVMANAVVCVAELTTSSGLAALIIGSEPAWIIILGWKFFGGRKPTTAQVLGMGLAFLSVYLCVDSTEEQTAISLSALLMLLTSVVLWAVGTLIQINSSKKSFSGGVFGYASYQLLCGGLVVTLLSPLVDDYSVLQQHSVSLNSIYAFLFLVFFGSVVVFSAYLWLSRNVEATKVSTYALVNPILAVWIGWAVAGEALTSHIQLATITLLVGLFFVLFYENIHQRWMSKKKTALKGMF